MKRPNTAIIRLMGIIICIVMFSAFLLPAPRLRQAGLSAQEKQPPDTKTGTPQTSVSPTVTAEWTDKPLRTALETIGEIANVNIMIDFKISNDDTVTVTFRNLDWRLALEETVRVAQCILEEINPSLFRVTKPPTISMDLKNAPLDEVVRNIAKLAGVNVIMADDVKGNITMILSDVPWTEALDSIIKTAGFSLVQEKHNVVRIVRTETLKDQLETRIFQLKYLRPPGAYKATITTPYAVGSVQPTSDAIKEFTLLNILKNMLSRKGGTLIGTLEYDIKSNCIIVQDTKIVLDAIAKILEQLDVPPEQVLIELKFISTSNEDLYNRGLKYNWSGDQPASDIMTSNPSPNQVTTTLPFGFGRKQGSFHQLFLNSYDVSTVLRLFKRDTKSKFIQEPNLITLDGKEATVFVGELIRYAVTRVVSTPTGTSNELAEAAPVSVGFQLWVTPYIIKETNKLIITLIPRLENLYGTRDGFEEFTVAGMSIRLPQVRQSTLVTNLFIESDQTAIIGGLVDEQMTKSLDRVPLLGDIPLLGGLFKYKGDTLTEKKLLVFVTPHIIKSAEESVKILENKAKNIETPIEIPEGPKKDKKQ